MNDMIYELKLDQPVHRFSFIDIEENKRVKEKLESFTDFEKKLQYYNINIHTLSFFSMQPQIYFEITPEDVYKVYCGCNNCRKLPDFSLEEEQIYIRLRAKEVKRLVTAINASKNYKEKLHVFLNTNGYHLGGTLEIYDNVEIDTEMDPERKMYALDPAIDLRPKNRAEISAYNEFVKQDFKKKYRTDLGFSEHYLCFDFEKQKARLERTLSNSVDPHNLILYCKNYIESYFKYPESLKQEPEPNHIIKSINEQLKRTGWLGHHLFAKIVLGVEIDLDETILDEEELLRYTHTYQIVKFYKYLLSKLKDQQSSLNGKGLLKSLMKDNPIYERFVNEYDEKLENVADFLNKEEFVNEEIERVQKEFILPMDVAVSGPFAKAAGFHADKYIKGAYDILRAGRNPDIERFLRQGRREYVDFRRIMNNDFSEANNADELVPVENGIIAALQRGVAYIMYQKFLKDQKNLETNLAVEEVQDTKAELSITEKYLAPYKDVFNNDADYQTAIKEINYFFQTGNISIKKPLFVKGGNIRNLAFAMGEIWRSQKNNTISYNYLVFYKKLFSIFADQKIDKNHLFSCNLYKYSLSKT